MKSLNSRRDKAPVGYLLPLNEGFSIEFRLHLIELLAKRVSQTTPVVATSTGSTN